MWGWRGERNLFAARPPPKFFYKNTFDLGTFVKKNFPEEKRGWRMTGREIGGKMEQ